MENKEHVQENYEVENKPNGGVAYGPGYVISWQRGPLSNGRNGAFLSDILEVIIKQIDYYQAGPFYCEENNVALSYLSCARDALIARQNRRLEAGKLGSHIPD